MWASAGEDERQRNFEVFPWGLRMYGVMRARAGMWVRRMRAARRDAGMVTSEYAMGLIAAVGFAGAAAGRCC